MQKIYVGASWKMNKTISEGIQYVKALQEKMNNIIEGPSDIIVFVLPTYLSLDAFSKTIYHPNLRFGSQNCFWEDEGAYTGEVSPMHLKDAGCTFAELGHFERRRILKEDNLMINKKIKACIRNGLTPIVCIGEPEKPKKTDEAKAFLKKQIDQLTEGLPSQHIRELVIAYEPVWAIGSSQAATPEYVKDVLAFLRQYLGSRYGEEAGREAAIIYGGAVNADTAGKLLAIEGNNGIFIGRASLDLELFSSMIDVARRFEKNIDRQGKKWEKNYQSKKD